MTRKTESINGNQTRPRLVRSCQACVRAKRKCSYELPSCARCRDRHVECYYANTPLTTACAESRHVRVRSKEPKGGWLEHDTVPSSASLTWMRLAREKYIIQIDSETVHFMMSLAKRHIFMYGLFNATVFVHPDLPKTQLARNVQTICRTSLSQPKLNGPMYRRLIAEIDHQIGAIIVQLRGHTNLYDMLGIVQALILLQIVSLFLLESRESFFQRAVSRQRLLEVCTNKLYNMAPSQLPATLSGREAFLLAESIRRTMLVSTEFRYLYHAGVHYWIEHTPSADLLPFERRAKLWDMSEADFYTAFGQGQQDMISWREFADLFDTGQLSQDSLTPFEMMLLVAAKGKPAVDEAFQKSTQCPQDGSA